MRQQRSFPSEAVILKHRDLGEADRILTLFTPYKGKFDAVAKGTRRPISRKAGHLELLCHSQLQVAMGRNLDIITQAQGIDTYLHLRDERWHTTCGFYLAELVDRFIEENTQHTEVYRLLLMSLQDLEADAIEWLRLRNQNDADYTRDRSKLLLRYFEIHLLSFIGYEPVFRQCAHCDVELKPEENGFSTTLGGALCPNCNHLWGQALSVNALKVLRILQRTEWTRIPRFHLEQRLHNEIQSVMHGLIRFHLERDLKSWSFLEMLDVQPEPVTQSSSS